MTGLLLPLAAFSQSNDVSRVIEAAGRVEFARAGLVQWQPATNGLALGVGDRLRTGPQSRAALQLADRSIIRLNERTLMELQPPRHAEKRRFGLPSGSIYFFNRERPANVEFETPLAAGAIRGTEFYLEAAAASMQLALLDGAVELDTSTEKVSLQSGEQVRLVAGQPAVKTPLLNARAVIQWALYYPAVVNPADLPFTETDRTVLRASLEHYRAGDLNAALAAAPEPAPGSEAQQVFRAALELSVGRVDSAESRLNAAPNAPAARALRELIATVRGDAVSETSVPANASDFLARSYSFQSRSQLEAARSAARRATELAPDFGFAHARLAEMEFAFGERRAALAALEQALKLSPRHAQAHAIRGFVFLEQEDARAALDNFDRALAIDAALGQAWLGRGLALMRLRQRDEALNSLQRAAALEPQRGLFRSYLAKGYGEQREDKLAEKDFRLARELDANDPTAWLYSALHAWQLNRLNEAVRDLEQSSDLNDNRSVFRSQLLLDRDRAVRSANLAAIYNDAGLPEVSRHVAARSVNEDYANFSGHLFLANSYQSLEDPNRFDLRFEAARHSELLLANLLAPPGAGNLSQLLPQQEHLRYFEPRPVAVSSFTEYRDNGDWLEAGSVFGTLGGLSYAVDALYESRNGQRQNEHSEHFDASVQLKQRVTAQDSAYVQIGRFESAAGDVAQYYNPAQGKRGFHVNELQEPSLYLGWHHEWSPAHRTLLLLARLKDDLDFHDPQPNVLFLRRSGPFSSVETPPGFSFDLEKHFTLCSAELQHLWQSPSFSVIAGGRWQYGEVESEATLNRVLTGTVTDQSVEASLERGNVYTYGSWQVAEPLRLIAGLSYDHIRFPENTDLAPLARGEETRELLAPKAALEFAPWKRGLFRASYTRSLGGLYFDNSVRLEPAQLAGFTQAYRSLAPESVAGLVPGSEFETISLGFDQSWKSGTYLGVTAEHLSSDGRRTVGVLTNSSFLPVPDAPSGTRQTLDFRECSVSTYFAQLLGENASVGARYRISDARLETRFPQIPNGTPGLATLEQDSHALLHQLSLTANFHHRSGLFAQWESVWFHQNNEAASGMRDEDFWQHNIFVGYRFPRRHAEMRLGLLNLADTDYRLNPLNLHSSLPRERTFVASLRLNF